MTSQKPLPDIPRHNGGTNFPPGPNRTRLAKLLKRHYRAGKSIGEIALELNRSYGFARTLLIEAGTKLRPQGMKRAKSKEGS